MSVRDKLFLVALIVVAFIVGVILVYKAGDFSRSKDIEAIQTVLGSQKHKSTTTQAQVLH